MGYSTKSNCSWALVAKWLKTCREQHASCSEKDRDDRSWCPTQLLELYYKPSGEDVVKLIGTAYVKPDGDHITLSHCWGKGTLIRTLRENLPDFLIQVASLPKTFHDAILATRMLGVRYTWIDSLCIIQDDADDWAKEAPLMHKCFRNSNDGLFRPSAPRFLSELNIKLRKTDYDVIEEHLFDGEVEDAPLQQVSYPCSMIRYFSNCCQILIHLLASMGSARKTFITPDHSLLA
ncbi:putative het domain-containing protein [Botrytis fragariae]|uniref:Putative het domain-containing protein n=1 Tax=Botrytis fragariae TaxID=1964551 RepID=A0A8H6EFS4_9HELO|nr:putative het domain-containing protein [Botrytis fragariae]KAF5870556.1 putative het domain-containing protein [Botrytis fragariae]